MGWGCVFQFGKGIESGRRWRVARDEITEDCCGFVGEG